MSISLDKLTALAVSRRHCGSPALSPAAFAARVRLMDAPFVATSALKCERVRSGSSKQGVHPTCTLFAPQMHPDASARGNRAPFLHPECTLGQTCVHPECTQNATGTAKTGNQHEALSSKTPVVEHKGIAEPAGLFSDVTSRLSVISAVGQNAGSVRRMFDAPISGKKSSEMPFPAPLC